MVAEGKEHTQSDHKEVEVIGDLTWFHLSYFSMLQPNIDFILHTVLTSKVMLV